AGRGEGLGGPRPLPRGWRVHERGRAAPEGRAAVIDNSARIERMRAALGALLPSMLEIRDDSHKHVGHEGARDGRGHFAVDITSVAFEGMAPLARHRCVYAALG